MTTEAEVMVSVTFKYSASDDVNDVRLIGGWNNWSEPVAMARDPDAPHEWHVVKHLPPGAVYFKFLRDAEWVTAPNYDVVDNGIGGLNNILFVQPPPFDAASADEGREEEQVQEQEQEAEAEAEELEAEGKVQKEEINVADECIASSADKNETSDSAAEDIVEHGDSTCGHETDSELGQTCNTKNGEDDNLMTPAPMSETETLGTRASSASSQTDSPSQEERRAAVSNTGPGEEKASTKGNEHTATASPDEKLNCTPYEKASKTTKSNDPEGGRKPVLESVPNKVDKRKGFQRKELERKKQQDNCTIC